MTATSAARALLAGFVLVVLVVVRTPEAAAQSKVTNVTDNDRAAAQNLFDAAKALMSAGRFDEACPKLAESQRLDPAGGTLLNLGLCYEGQGRLATAWTDYKAALAIARRDGRVDRVKAAQERIAALEPRLPRITITSHGGAATITLDGRVVGSAEWGTPIPVDPGAHVVKAELTGAPPWQSRVELAQAGRAEVDVPARALQIAVALDVPGARAPEDAPAVLATPARNRRIASYVLGGTALVAVGVGAVFGLEAFSRRHASDDMCRPGCTMEAVKDNNDARAAARVSDVAFAGGAIVGGIAAYLWYSSRPPASATEGSSATVLAPGVGADFAALQVSGTW